MLRIQVPGVAARVHIPIRHKLPRVRLVIRVQIGVHNQLGRIDRLKFPRLVAHLRMHLARRDRLLQNRIRRLRILLRPRRRRHERQIELLTLQVKLRMIHAHVPIDQRPLNHRPIVLIGAHPHLALLSPRRVRKFRPSVISAERNLRIARTNERRELLIPVLRVKHPRRGHFRVV